MTEPTVPWIVAPRLALCRAIALEMARERGRSWDRLSQRARDALVAEAGAVLDQMIRDGGGIQFEHEWRTNDLRPRKDPI